MSDILWQSFVILNLIEPRKLAFLAVYVMIVLCLAYASDLNMEATYSSKFVLDFQRAARGNTRGKRTLHNHFCENFQVLYLGSCFSVAILTTSKRLKRTTRNLSQDSWCPYLLLNQMILGLAVLSRMHSGFHRVN
jgi:hypothetical protein